MNQFGLLAIFFQYEDAGAYSDRVRLALPREGREASLARLSNQQTLFARAVSLPH